MAPTHTKLRMSDDLRRRIEVAAKAHGSSLNQEVVERLERSFGSERLWLVRGEDRARVVLYGRDKLLILLEGESPEIPIELVGTEEDIALLREVFHLEKEREG